MHFKVKTTSPIVRKRKKTQQILTIERLKQDSVWYFYLKNYLSDDSVIKKVAD